MRQFAAIGEEWPLDFTAVSASGSGADTTSVLAAAVDPSLVEQIQSTLAPSQLTPERIILRPFAAASLLRRRAAADKECRLIVDFLADEADLTVLSRGEVAFMRTVRVPTTDDKQVVARAILGEIRRTIAAAQNQLGGQRVEQVSVFGSGEEHAVLKAEAEQQLSLTVSLFDPFDQVHLSGELASSLPDNHGRYAPLLGMLADELTGVRHAIDFLNPRRRPKPPSKRKQHTMIGAIAGVVVAGVVGLIVFMYAQRKSEVAKLEEQRTAWLRRLRTTLIGRNSERKSTNSCGRTLIGWMKSIESLSSSPIEIS